MVLRERKVAAVRPFSLKFLVALSARLRPLLTRTYEVVRSHAHKFVRVRATRPDPNITLMYIIACANSMILSQLSKKA